jgi:antitoxin component of MazEF toxin-antitoxin module
MPMKTMIRKQGASAVMTIPVAVLRMVGLDIESAHS